MFDCGTLVQVMKISACSKGVWLLLVRYELA